jgi:hypothetical protein
MIAADKLAHFCAGIAVAAVVYPFGLVPAAVATIAAAVGKELWDAQGNGTPEVMDAVATLLGGCVLAGWFWFAKGSGLFLFN